MQPSKSFDAETQARIAKSREEQRIYWVEKQRIHRDKQQEEAQQKSAEQHADVAEGFRLERVLDISWGKLRSNVVDYYYHEMSKPNMKHNKLQAYAAAAEYWSVSEKFVRVWVKRFNEQGPANLSSAWAKDKWGQNPSVRWQLCDKIMQAEVKLWVRQHAVKKPALTLESFREYLNRDVIPRVWDPEDAYKMREIKELAIEHKVPLFTLERNTASGLTRKVNLTREAVLRDLKSNGRLPSERAPPNLTESTEKNLVIM